MHNTIENKQAVTQAWVGALSHPRLNNYRSFFKVANDDEALRVYQWNEEVGASFFRLIRLIEIVLRNRFHAALSARYGVVGRLGSRDWYKYVNLNPRSKAKISEVTHFKRGSQTLPRKPARGPDDVVSQLSFGFWPHLLDLTSDCQGQKIAWGTILVEVLPGHRQRQATYWEKEKHRDILFARLDLCNDIRNRVSHHEPVWKLGPLMEERRARTGKKPALLAKAPTNAEEALTRLQTVHGKLFELLGWLDPVIADQHGQSDIHDHCERLIQVSYLQAYRKDRSVVSIDLAHVKSIKRLRIALRYAEKRQLSIRLIDTVRSSLCDTKIA